MKPNQQAELITGQGGDDCLGNIGTIKTEKDFYVANIYEPAKRRWFSQATRQRGALVRFGEHVVFTPEAPEIEDNGSFAEWMGFYIVRKRDFPSGSKEVGYIVTKAGCNVMPGACYFHSVDQARKGIAAYVIACRVGLPDKCDSDIFWALMELTK